MTARPLDRSHLESEIERFFFKRVRLVGGYALKLVPITAGVPDRLVLMPGGRSFLVELKQDGEDPSPVQDVWHERSRAIGHPVYVLRGRAECLEFIRRIVNSYHPD